MKFNFDEIINRQNTYSIKHNHKRSGMPEDAIALWVADMDFRTPPCITEVLRQQADHGIFGYSDPDNAYFDILMSWYKRRFNWKTQKEWIVPTPGVVTAIHIAIEALTSIGDGVLISQPVYHPFSSAVTLTGRKLLVNELVCGEGGYTIDFDDFEEKAKQAKLFILCNPHNPVGRVWTVDELTKIGEICLRNGVIVVSDEIHQDFVYLGHRHVVFENIDPKFAEITVTCTAPSKTFNIAGLPCSNIFISNPKLREKYKRQYSAFGLSQLGVMGIAACKAAYESGEDWMTQMVDYISGNMTLIGKFLQEKVPQIKLIEPQGTYLAWLDCKALGYDQKVLEHFMTNKAKLWLSTGTQFGSAGEGFQRVNVACPRSTIQEMLNRLEAAVKTGL